MADEYQKVAALVCMDIDTIFSAAERNPERAMDFLELLKAKKDDIVNNQNIRDTRYKATCNVFAVAVNSPKD